MKLLCVIPSMEAGGAERQMAHIIKHLRKDSFSLKLCLFNQKGKLLDSIPADVEIHDLRKKSRWSVGTLIRRLSKLIALEKPDIVYSRLQYANGLVWLALRLSGLTSIKHVINEETILSQNLAELRAGRLLKLWIQKAYGTVSHIIAPCLLSKQDLVSNFGIPESNISVVYNAIDLQSLQGFQRAEPRSEISRNGRPTIISVGSLRPVKGHRFLLRALKDILRYYPNCHLQILGEGPERASLEKYANELGIDSHVSLPGVCSPYQLVANADVFVMPSLREGIPAAVLEAMALRVPVVASRVGGIPEILVDGESGFLVEPTNWQELSDKVIDLLNSRKKRALFSDHGARIVKDRFDVSKNVRKLEGVFFSMTRVDNTTHA